MDEAFFFKKMVALRNFSGNAVLGKFIDILVLEGKNGERM
jgi:hypothetical protein